MNAVVGDDEEFLRFLSLLSFEEVSSPALGIHSISSLNKDPARSNGEILFQAEANPRSASRRILVKLFEMTFMDLCRVQFDDDLFVLDFNDFDGSLLLLLLLPPSPPPPPEVEDKEFPN